MGVVVATVILKTNFSRLPNEIRTDLYRKFPIKVDVFKCHQLLTGRTQGGI